VRGGGGRFADAGEAIAGDVGCAVKVRAVVLCRQYYIVEAICFGRAPFTASPCSVVESQVALGMWIALGKSPCSASLGPRDCLRLTVHLVGIAGVIVSSLALCDSARLTDVVPAKLENCKGATEQRDRGNVGSLKIADSTFYSNYPAT
jgi:hypothetical protein